MGKESGKLVPIYKEAGILKKSGKGFHSAGEFACENLIHVAWSDRYLCDSRYEVKRDYLDYYSLIYVISGKMGLEYEGSSITVSENEFMLLDFHRPHHYWSMADRLDKWEIIFSGNATAPYYDLITGNWGCSFKAHGRIKTVLDEMMKEIIRPLPDDYMLSMHFNTLFTYLLKDHRLKLSQPINKALNYMNSSYFEPIQVAALADQVGLSRAYFSKLFVKETGQTPSEYLMEVRINKAKEMLSEDMVTVSEVAERCGFVNDSHFIRVFHARTGSTPAAFRNFF
ncbi:MAG: AraC family transcriptional regulator, partial [Lachnospiraceae bacterium]|nr:AraC family transcriptional regulator [Lachnospiraceae bacterium]